MNTLTNIKSIRAKTNLSQREFSDKYGIPKRTIENWESGASSPPDYVMNLLEFAIENEYQKKSRGT